MYLLLIFLSFLSFCSASFFGRYLGSKGSSLLAIGSLIFSFFLSLMAFYEVGMSGSSVYVSLCGWFKSEILSVKWGFLFDSLTVTMCVIVTFVSSLVHLYSVEYMSHDPHLPRFMSYLSLFTFFMLILITADNFLQMFLGWEGVGLCSYLLINFWFTRVQANKAAIKAMLLNRIGDFCLIISILIISVTFKSLEYSSVAILTPFYKNSNIHLFFFEINVLTVVCLFLFLGAMGKSAQLGLHTWLPDAMEGPTPVSALIHAATMVTAGVFLLARCSFMYEHCPNILGIVTIIGASTAFFASSVGLVQNDLKKVIAYSTCSQLGYMVFACGSSDYSSGIFHLSNHAFFKALLFLSAGSIIHSINDEQDIRKMGGLKNFIPFTYSAVIIGTLALTGFPFLSGFYSKDLILELSFGCFTSCSHYSYYLGSFGAFFTSFYSIRLICLSFLVKPNGYRSVIGFASETYHTMFISLLLLLLPSMFVGYCTKDLFVGIGSDFLGSSIYLNPKSFHCFDSEFIDFFFKIFPLILSFIGAVLSFSFYMFGKSWLVSLKLSNAGRKLYSFLNRKWFFDKLYNEIFSQFVYKSGYNITYKQIDRGIFEAMGPHGISEIILKLSHNLQKSQTGSLYHYLLVILSSISIFICVYEIFFIFEILIDVKIIFLIFFSLCFIDFDQHP